MSDEEYFAIKDRAAARLRRIPHVTGVGVGGRERNGRPTGEIVIKVFVKKKKPAAEVPPEELIPPSFEGVPTDVVEMGPPMPVEEPVGVVNPHQMSMDESHTDPIRGGMYAEVVFDVLGFGGSGTLGCILRDKHNGSAVYGLTNAHVVTPDGGKLSRSLDVFQKDAADPTKLARVGIVTAGANDKRRDAAVVRLNPFKEWLPAIKEIGFVKGTHTVSVAEAKTLTYRVRKRGARTRLTHGVVIAVGVSAPNDSRVGDIVIEPRVGPPLPPDKPVFFSHSGDSGSAIVNEDDEIVGLLYASEGVDPANANLPARPIKTYATPITTVLGQFAKVERLDLEVAVAGPNPTEAAELKRVDLWAGAPVMTAADVMARGDPAYRRPLLGGLQLLAEPILGIPGATTLGCLVKDESSPGGAFVLTSFSGVSAHGTLPPTSETDVGQPDNDDSSTGCCSNTIGLFARGGPDHNAPTSALVRVGDGHQWLAEVLEIGNIEDIHTITSVDVIGNFQVRKYGAATRLTGGQVIAVGNVEGALPPELETDAILIRPNPNPFRTQDDVCFSHLIDRGAVVVDEINRVVGLLYREFPITDANGRNVIHGVATPIQIVLDQLNAIAGVDVKVATTKKVDEVQTVKNQANRTMAGEVPAGSFSPLPRAAPVAHARLDWLREELAESPAGHVVATLWRAHSREVRDLISRNRNVATVWHRSGGPALLQAFARATDLHTLKVPAELNGVPVATCLERIAHVFARYGGEALRSDLARVRPLLPLIGGASFDEFLLALEGI